MRPYVLKIGGNELDDPAFHERLAAIIVARRDATVIVHGGGRAISDLQIRLGLTPRTVDGLRVTDADSLAAAQMVLCGLANKQIVAALVAAGVEALGLSGVDRGLLRCRKQEHPSADLGYVGEIIDVRAEVLRECLAAGVVPVVAPISLGHDGVTYNVNADYAAAEIAVAIGAERIDFVSDVAGVLVDGKPAARLSLEEVGLCIEDGTAIHGMAAKLRSARSAVERGVPARIVDLVGLVQPSAGTWITNGPGPRGASAVEQTQHEGSNASEIIADADRLFVPTYRRPAFVLERGKGLSVWDTEGRRYLDFAAGIAVSALGHGDPAFAAAVAAQAAQLVHTSNLFYTAPQVELARRLVSRSFADRVFLCNSGTEANEAAIKFARKRARLASGAALDDPAFARTGIVAFGGGFHGRTIGSLAATSNAHYRAPFEPLMPGVTFAPFNELAAADAVIGETTCAVIAEPVQGEGGVHRATPEFLAGLRRLCDERGALLIFDEVQCGLGRTGRLWAYEGYGVAPDIMTLAKPLAGGLPIGAVLTTEAVASAMAPGDHGSTFAGGPLVCRSATVVFDRIAEPEFLDEVRSKGERLCARLRDLRSQHIRDVRGVGLLVGVELDGSAKPVIAAAAERGLLVIAAGENVLRLCPPLVVTRAEIDFAVDTLAACLDAAA